MAQLKNMGILGFKHVDRVFVLASFVFLAGPAWVAAATPKVSILENPQQVLLSFYSVTPPQLEQVREQGFTAIGPYYSNRARSLEYSAAAGLPVIYSVGPKLDFNTIQRPDLDAAEGELKDAVLAVAHNPNIAIWYLRNEELRHWRQAELEWLQRATALIRHTDPLRRPVMMYEPNHRTTADLLRTMPYLDIAAKGAYANHVGMKDARTWVRYSVEQLVAAAEQTGTLPVAALWMAADQDPEDVELIERWVRHDMYLSLALGAKGIVVWSGFNRRQGFREHFQHFYSAYATVTHELNGPQGWGGFFSLGNRQEENCVTVADTEKQQEFRYRGRKHEYPQLYAASFQVGPEKLLVIVNSSRESIKIDYRCAGFHGVNEIAAGVLKGEQIGSYNVALFLQGVQRVE